MQQKIDERLQKVAEERALDAFPPKYAKQERNTKKMQSENVDIHQPLRTIYIKGYHQAEKDILSEYGWLVSKVKILKLKYCHNREAVKAIEEAYDILNEFKQ